MPHATAPSSSTNTGMMPVGDEREQRRAWRAGALFQQLRLGAVFREREADASRKRIEREVV